MISQASFPSELNEANAKIGQRFRGCSATKSIRVQFIKLAKFETYELVTGSKVNGEKVRGILVIILEFEGIIVSHKVEQIDDIFISTILKEQIQCNLHRGYLAKEVDIFLQIPKWSFKLERN